MLKLQGVVLPRLGSIQDKMISMVYYRHQNSKLFEVLLDIYSKAMTVNPEMAKKVEPLVDDYIDSLIPGSKDFKRSREKDMLLRNQQALADVFNILKEGGYAE